MASACIHQPALGTVQLNGSALRLHQLHPHPGPFILSKLIYCTFGVGLDALFVLLFVSFHNERLASPSTSIPALTRHGQEELKETVAMRPAPEAMSVRNVDNGIGKKDTNDIRCSDG
ncbi:hypothetical protein ZHAS_00012505 [Anopheles sinensis]|uniref:Uncharacterized protein n=1 Tax=Anopheles sinensis TaxID=74873 RepID=A0A084W327_ANOSI|nr:hypothetical protein ZHAS_00012505 [Anopheles sinensis]